MTPPTTESGKLSQAEIDGFAEDLFSVGAALQYAATLLMRSPGDRPKVLDFVKAIAARDRLGAALEALRRDALDADATPEDEEG